MSIKRELFSLYFICHLSSLLLGQSQWVQQGAEWQYDGLGLGGTWTNYLFYEKDTIIQGKNCQVIQNEGFSANYDSLGNYSGLRHHPGFSRNYLYSSGDTVFWYKNNDFHILYNFNAYIGYSWDVGLDTLHGCNRTIITIDSISSEVFAGDTLLRYYTSSSLESSYIFGSIVERLGSLYFLFPIRDYWCDTLKVGVPEHDFYRIHCYQDDINGKWDTTYMGFYHDCESIYYVGSEEIHSNEFDLYPNPSRGELTIRFEKVLSGQLRLLDTKGSAMLKMKLFEKNQTQIELPEYINNGIYFLEFNSNDGLRTTKKIVVQKE